VTGDKPLPLPPRLTPWVELARWLRDMHVLTATEVRDVCVDLRRFPMWFRVSFSAEQDEIITGWNEWVVDWEAGRVRWKQDPPGIDYPLTVLWDAVADAVTRLRKRQERDGWHQAPIPEASRSIAPRPAESEPPRRGRRPVKRDATVAAMKEDIETKKETLKSLKDAKPESLEGRYSVDRKTIKAALERLDKLC
jgi:hypothetical protein